MQSSLFLLLRAFWQFRPSQLVQLVPGLLGALFRPLVRQADLKEGLSLGSELIDALLESVDQEVLGGTERI